MQSSPPRLSRNPKKLTRVSKWSIDNASNRSQLRHPTSRLRTHTLLHNALKTKLKSWNSLKTATRHNFALVPPLRKQLWRLQICPTNSRYSSLKPPLKPVKTNQLWPRLQRISSKTLPRVLEPTLRVKEQKWPCCATLAAVRVVRALLKLMAKCKFRKTQDWKHLQNQSWGPLLWKWRNRLWI